MLSYLVMAYCSISLLCPDSLNLVELVQYNRNNILRAPEREFLLTERKSSHMFANLIKAHTVISMILWGELVRYRSERDRYTHYWVPIPMTRMANATGLRKPVLIRNIIEPLKALGVIKQNRFRRRPNYGNGHCKSECFSYALCSPYALRFGAKPKSLALPYRLTTRQLAALRHKGRAHAKTKLEKALLNNLSQLRIDEETLSRVDFSKRAAEKRCPEQLFALTRLLATAINSESKVDEDGDPIEGWYFQRGSRVGRVYSSITMLPREARACLRYKGEPLVEIDQHASQPFLLLSFYNILKSAPEEVRAEASRFHALWEGDFYNNFAKLSGVELERNKMKEVFVQGMNAGIGICPRGVDSEVLKTVLRTFRETFPILTNRIFRMKTVRDEQIAETLSVEKSGKEKTHSQYAIQLQKIESQIFIDGIAAELLNKNILFYTVHDAIGCLPQDALTVSEYMKRHLSRIVGFTPVLNG